MSVNRDYVDGSVTNIYDADTGTVRENGGASDIPFEQRGAQIEFKVGDTVTFLRIGLPNGNVIVKDVGKKNG